MNLIQLFEIFKTFSYALAAFLLIIGLKKLSSPDTARQGNTISAAGMLLAVIVALVDFNILSYTGIGIGLGVGAVIGFLAARLVPMTSMPEMVALLNGFGGGSSLLLGWSAFLMSSSMNVFGLTVVGLSIFIGAVTFVGSILAWAKLSQLIPGRPISLPLHNFMSALILSGIITSIILWIQAPYNMTYLYCLIGLSALLGLTSVMSIGGGDMPVVISLLNSYSGIAACASGFVIMNLLLIVAGAMVGASGIILTMIMCKSMNRSLRHVLFSGFGSSSGSSKALEGKEAKSIATSDAYYVLEAAQSVVVVPGYGMAVAQAQHVVKELAQILEANGTEVRFAIHPVAGRMPGHMNVLLAEADVPYDVLIEMDDINPTMDSVDVCLVIGANDVVNPDALNNEDSPIYGMPIIEVTRCRSTFVLKRSMNPGFAGIQNPLFFEDNTQMIFGDAKQTLQDLITEFKS